MLQSAGRSSPQAARPLQQQQQLRESIRLWLNAIMEKHRTTARQIAVTSGVAPSTVYRALEPDGDFVMSTTIMAKIAKQFGEAMPAGMAQQQAMGNPGFSDRDAVEFEGELPTLTAKAGTDRYRVKIMSDVLNLEGFRIGDIVEFDMAREPAAGDIVAAQKHMTQRFGAETVLRLYRPPYLLTRSSDPLVDPTPLLVDNISVRIVGVFRRLVRDAPD